MHDLLLVYKAVLVGCCPRVFNELLSRVDQESAQGFGDSVNQSVILFQRFREAVLSCLMMKFFFLDLESF